MFDILMQRRFELPFISTHHTHKEACPKRAKEREFNPWLTREEIFFSEIFFFHHHLLKYVYTPKMSGTNIKMRNMRITSTNFRVCVLWKNSSKKTLNIFRFSYIFQKYENFLYEPCTILCSYLHTRYIHVICNMIYDTAVAFPVYGRSNCYVSNISPAAAA